MKYFVVQDGGRQFLVRTRRGCEETFTREGVWTESGLLARAAPVAEVGAYQFYDRVHEILRGLRAGLPCVAVFSSSYRVDELINVTAVMRRRDGVEEWLGRDGVWRAEHRDLDGQVHLPVSEEEVERLKWTAALPDWFVLHDGGAYPYAVVRKIPSAEEAFTRDLRWERTDLLGRDDLRVEECGKVIPFDARAAIEIGVRTDRRTPRGTEYFALWDRSAFESAELHSVIRRTEAGDEIHAGRRGWLPSAVVREIERGDDPFYWALPVGAEEAEAIIARQTWTRGFLVLSEADGRTLPVAVVRLHGDHEEAFTRDLVWGPSDLLTRVADEGLLVEELPPGSMGHHEAYRLAVKIRLRRRAEWTGPYWYYAILPNRPTSLELADAHGLVRTNAGDDTYEQGFHNGKWTSSHKLDALRTGGSYDEELPISPDEAERLMELLRGARRP